VVLIRQIRTLLYEQGFTIGGAKQQLMEGCALENDRQWAHELYVELEEILEILNPDN